MNAVPYQFFDASRFFMNLMSVAQALTARQMEAVCTLWQPVLNATLGAFDQNPVSMKVEGIRSLAALSPAFHDIASRFPDSVTLQYGLGTPRNDSVSPDAGRSFSDVRFAFNAAEPWRNLESLSFVTALHTKDHAKVDWRDLITDPLIGNKIRPLGIETVTSLPDVDLVRFWTDASDKPPVYLSAPMSGHFSTLVFGVIQNYVDAGFPVYVRDLKDAAMTPNETPFDMSAQIEADMIFLEEIFKREGRPAHAVAVCQALVPLTIASALMHEDQVPHRPETLFLASGPADISVTQSIVNRFAERTPESWFESQELDVVPGNYPGAGKTVRSGHRQIAQFMIGNPGRHADDISRLFDYISRGSGEYERHRPFAQHDILTALREDNIPGAEADFLRQLAFRIEYLTMADQHGASYMDAVIGNFKDNGVVSGALTYRGRIPNLKTIACPVLTADAENDDISSIGQTMGLHPHLSQTTDRRALIVPGKGHFWWAGGSAREKQWPQIMSWQLDPAGTNIPTFNPDMIRDAQIIHERNQADEKAKLEGGKSFGITLRIGGIDLPLGGWPTLRNAA
jgi:poly(3-hydroxybutyrate) depolymerase